jgi:hypothetical protein
MILGALAVLRSQLGVQFHDRSPLDGVLTLLVQALAAPNLSVPVARHLLNVARVVLDAALGRRDPTS